MKLFLPLLLSLCTTSLVAQDLANGWGLELTPHLSSRRLVAADQIGFEETRAIEAQEKASYGFGIGVFYRNRAEKVGTRWGIRYQQTGFASNRREFPTDPRPVYPFTEVEYEAKIIEVPMFLDFYQNLGAKSSFLFSLGLSAGVHFGQEFTTLPFDQDGNALAPVVAEENYRGFNFSFMTSMGYETQIGSGLILGLAPQFQYWLMGTVISEEAELNRNLYNLGLRLTLMRIN